VCVYRVKVQRREEKDSRYIQEASVPTTVTLYQICNTAHVLASTYFVAGSVTIIQRYLLIVFSKRARLSSCVHIRVRSYGHL
jgi:hypothetical protein